MVRVRTTGLFDRISRQVLLLSCAAQRSDVAINLTRRIAVAAVHPDSLQGSEGPRSTNADLSTPGNSRRCVWTFGSPSAQLLRHRSVQIFATFSPLSKNRVVRTEDVPP